MHYQSALPVREDAITNYRTARSRIPRRFYVRQATTATLFHGLLGRDRCPLHFRFEISAGGHT